MKKQINVMILVTAALAITSCGNDPSYRQTGSSSTVEQQATLSQSPASSVGEEKRTGSGHAVKPQHVTQTQEVDATDIRSIRMAEDFEGNIFVKMEPNADRITATLNIEHWSQEEQPLLFVNTVDQTLTAGIRYPEGTASEQVNHTIGNAAAQESATLSIIVPEKLYEEMSLTTKSGYITVERMNAAFLQAKTGAGNLDMKQVNAEELEGETGAGDVFFKISEPKHYQFMAQTGSGKVELLGEVYEDDGRMIAKGNGFNEAQLVTSRGNVRVYE
ncbi:DUF4097 family beta strand repeat-containing protein [Paenibacillus urinalis]|uniref:DUF4097 family beta strand repeat-containing protein n=1 Tax=Paenibacillus urinalis TaxID=521520 RepID=A0ABY7XHN5_9BACL|nr:MULTISPECIES: DUF4097 family beta strand repeat-containing protein [Paenibacillus]WDH99517.1 DUF4097 family beta strand repeat-containing protein [Paenibacillus urinalis]WDI03150.1 DUF4097 family beta strand repeat-containing protein [Paenibacillus urinalis]GAK41856.1 hypothetical protein TCA2_4348 [Paenibacillus sp. TCA20]